MKLMSFWSKFFIALAITILATTGAVVGVFAGQKEQIDMGGSIKYTVPYFTVEFLNYDDTVFETQQVSYGHDATKPATDPTRPGYTFKSWTDYTNITKDRSVTANWIKNEAYLTEYVKWQAIVNASAVGSQANIEQIEFVSSVPSGATLIGSVGGTDATASRVWTEDCGIFDVKAYYTTLASGKYKVSFYAPCTIYAPNNCNYLFSYSVSAKRLTNLTSISFGNFDTGNVTHMSGMFDGCKALTSLNLSSFNTSNVTDMPQMFSGCAALTSLNLSNFDTSKVTDMAWMFDGCSSLSSLDVSGFDTSKVTNMAQMFRGCSKLTSLNISNFNTSNVTDMRCIFYDCSKLNSLDLSNFNTSKVINMLYMFYNCSKLTSIDLSSFDTSKVTTVAGLFFNCSALISLNVSSFNVSNVTSMTQMFYKCSKLTSLNLSSFDMSNTTSTSDMLKGCSSLTEIKTPKAIGSAAVDLPSSNWRNEANPAAGAYSKIESSMLTSGSITLRPGYFINLNAEYPRAGLETSDPLYYISGSFQTQRPESYASALGSEYQGLNTTVAYNSNYIQVLPKDPNLWTTVGTNKIQTTMYIWGNSQYTIRVPEGYFMQIVQYAYDGTVVGESWTFGNEYVSDGEQNDDGGSIFTHTKAYKLQVTLWNTGKTVKPSSITTSALSSLYITMESDEVVNVWYGHEIPMPRVYVLGMTYSDRMEGTGFTTSTKDNTLFISYATPASVGTSTHWEIMAPTIYNLYLKTGNATYNGQKGTIKLGEGYAGQRIWGDLSRIIEPDGYSLTKFTQASGSKGTFVTSNGGSSSLTIAELIDAQDQEFGYTMGPGDATIQFKFTKNTLSYLLKTWQTALSSANSNFTNILSIEFTNTKPTGTGYTTISVGASAANGLYAYYPINKEPINDVTAYIKTNSSDSSKYDVIIYSPCTIYAPIDSSNLFYECLYTKTFKLAKLNTSNVTNMQGMFSSCMDAETIDLSGFNTSKVTNMSSMFYFDGGSVTTLDVSSFDTSNVTDMSLMFALSDNYSLTSIIFSSKFVTTKVTNMNSMFSGCNALKSLDLSTFDTSNISSSSTTLFSGCESLEFLTTPKTTGEVEIPLLGTWIRNDSSSLAKNGTSYISLLPNETETYPLRRVSFLPEGSIWQAAISSGIGNANSNIRTIIFTDVEPEDRYSGVYVSGESLFNIGALSLNSQTADGSWLQVFIKKYSTSDLYDLVFYSKFPIYAPSSSTRLFSNLSDPLTNLESIEFGNFNTDFVSYWTAMFSGASSLTKLNLSKFDLTSLRVDNGMISSCTSLTEIKTPKAIGSTSVNLPTISGKYWFDESTLTAYTQLNSTNTNKTLVLSSGYSFLRKDWKTISTIRSLLSNSSSSLTSIIFTNTIPTDTTYNSISVGATNSSGTTAYSSRTGIFDVTLYYVQSGSTITKCVFYSPVTIYMPTDASSLFNFSSLTELDFSCSSFKFTTTANNTITACTKLTKITRPLEVGSAEIQLPVIEGYQWQTRYRVGSRWYTITYETLPAKQKNPRFPNSYFKTIDLAAK